MESSTNVGSFSLMTAVSGIALVLGFVLMVSCEKADPEEKTNGNPSAALPDSASSGTEPDSGYSKPFVSRVAIFMEATREDMDRTRLRLPPDDYYVIADDLMYYRSSAYEYLEQRNIPVIRLVGRRALVFMVGAEARSYDFSALPTLDIIVLYEPGREPKAIAPPDLHEVGEYFGL